MGKTELKTEPNRSCIETGVTDPTAGKNEINAGALTGTPNFPNTQQFPLDWNKMQEQLRVVGALKNKLDDQQGIVKDLTEKISKATNDLDDLKKSKIDYITTLGIFVGLFTFISVEFQIFRSDFSVRETTGLSLIILASLMTFVLMIDLLIKQNLEIFETKNEINTKSPLASFIKLGSSLSPTVSKISYGIGFKVRIVIILLIIFLMGTGILLFSGSKNNHDSSTKNNSSQNIININPEQDKNITNKTEEVKNE